jgi:hypothetical protein
LFEFVPGLLRNGGGRCHWVISPSLISTYHPWSLRWNLFISSYDLARGGIHRKRRYAMMECGKMLQDNGWKAGKKGECLL